MISFKPSSKTQGQLVKAKRSKARAEIVAAKVVRAPGKRVSPSHFQTALRMLALD